MRRGTVIEVVAIAFCIGAALISYKLVLKHLTGSSGAAWFEAGCADKPGGGRANCAAVLASPYSYFPPQKPGGAVGGPHVPVAFLGLVYYSTLMMWLIGVGRPSPRRRRLHFVPLGLVGLGLAGSAYFMNIMFRVLDEWCLWCVVTHALNLLIAMCLVWMWPRRLKPAAAPDGPRDGVSSGMTAPPVPSARTILITIAAIIAVAYAELNLLGLKTWKLQAAAARESHDACMEAVRRIKGDTDILSRNWQSAPKRPIAVRPDDPVRLGPGADPTSAVLEVVVFSDFECPSCKRFATFLDEQAQPLFEGRIKTIFKHYPLDRTCNTRASRTVHQHACAAMSMAEAARMLGGNAAFWEIHDHLFEHRDALAQGKITPDAIAAKLQLNPTAFHEAMNSQAVALRVAEDIEQARLCEIKGTPAVFVEGRLVDMLAVTELGFWDKLADAFWEQIRTPRPASTRPNRLATTPDSQGPKDDP